MPPFAITAGAKIGGMVAAVLFVFGLGFWQGHRVTQQAWDASVTAQATASAKTVIAQATVTAQLIREYWIQKGRADSAANRIKKEVIRYVDSPAPKCVVDPEFERVFDAASRVVPPAPGAAGRVDAESGSESTTAEVLSAHADLTERYFALADRHDALVEWVQTSYDRQRP